MENWYRLLVTWPPIRMVGRILEIDAHAGEAGQFGPQVLDDLVHQLFAFRAGLQVNHDLAVVRAAQRGCRRAAHGGHERLHVLVRAENIGHGLLILHHLVDTKCLARLP